jgi:ATP-dependent Clp protease protease subunit
LIFQKIYVAPTLTLKQHRTSYQIKINQSRITRKRKAALPAPNNLAPTTPPPHHNPTMESLARTTLRSLRPRATQLTTPRIIRSLTTTSQFQNPYQHGTRQQPTQQQTPPTAALPLPFVTETVNGGYHTSDIFSRLLKERIICLNGEVEEVLSASIVAQLLFLEADNPSKPISLYINSPGGSVTAGLAIYDTMQYIRSPVTTICLGQAASMGSLLLCGGAPGQRYVLPHSRIMVHQVSGGYSGQASDIAIHAKEILRVREQLNLIYKRHLTVEKSLEEIERVMERDFFMGAQEALEWGIVDKILDRREEAGGKK